MSAEEGQTRKSFIVDVVTTAALQLVAKARGIILLPIIVRAGNDALYGTWSMLYGLVALLVPLANLSIHQSLLRYAASLSSEAARHLFRRTLLFSAAVSTAVAALLFVALSTLGVEHANQLLGGYATPAVLLFTCLQVPLSALVRTNSAFLRSRGHVALGQVSELAAQFFATLAAAVVFLIGLGLGTAQGVVSLVFAIHVLATGATAISRPSRHEGTLQTQPETRTLLAFALPFIPSSISDWLLFLSDRYLVALFFGAGSAGVYAAAYALAQGVQMVSYPVEYALTPMLPRLWDQGRREEAARYISGSLRISVGLLLAAIGTLTPIAGDVLGGLGSPEMRAQGARLVPVICLGMLSLSFARTSSLVLLVDGKGSTVTRSVGIVAALNLALNLVLVPRMGALGAALTTFLAYAIYAGLIVRRARPLVPRLFHPGQLVGMIGAAAVAGACLLPSPSTLSSRLLQSTAFVVVYGVLCLVFRAVSIGELAALVRQARALARSRVA
jgi:O-antigen/teichoic acid export membrane protein